MRENIRNDEKKKTYQKNKKMKIRENKKMRGNGRKEKKKREYA